MRTVEEIEAAVASLSPEELRTFREWFFGHNAQFWDRQFEDDVRNGRLDMLAKEALNDARGARDRLIRNE